MFLFNPAGSVSELKLLGIQCEDRPAFFAGRSFLIPSSRDTSFLPTQTSIPIPRPLLPVDRFPSFIVIASPSVITTTLSESPKKPGFWHNPARQLNSPSVCKTFNLLAQRKLSADWAQPVPYRSAFVGGKVRRPFLNR